jgi:hypothetical protein
MRRARGPRESTAALVVDSFAHPARPSHSTTASFLAAHVRLAA